MFQRRGLQTLRALSTPRVWRPAQSDLAPSTRSFHVTSVVACEHHNHKHHHHHHHPHPHHAAVTKRQEHVDALPIEQVLSHIELMESWSCSGCGIELQHEEPKKVGYLPKPLLTKIQHIRELKKLRCERCFQITNYGKITDAKLPYNEYEKRVMELKAKDMLMIQLVDILDITGSLLPKARHVFGKKEVMLVVNKGDLIPEKSGIRRLMRRIQTQAKEAGIENIRAVYLVSAMKGIGMKEIVDDIRKYRKGRDICVVGAANVGKSTFLNGLMKFLVDRKWQHNHRKYMKLTEVPVNELDDEELLDAEDSGKQDEPDVYLADGESIEMYDDADEEEREMTMSPLPGTTLAVQHLPIMANNELFNILDTPGLIVDTQRQKLVETLALDGAKQLRDVFPSKTLPMTTYRLQSGRSLFLGALARFDYETTSEHKDKNLVLLSWHGVLPGHLSKTANAMDTFIKHAGGILAPPRGLDALSFTGPLLPSLEVNLKDYITNEVKVKSKNPKKPKRTSVVELEIPGFGWLTVTAVDLDGTEAAEQTLLNGKITISTCRGLSVVPRSPLFPFEMSTSKSATWKS
ncbi:hypothetical protein Poli38472_007715 [Pythium oligandrum]|uniref:G domain-containing protein n=1 Tax=Pythium oligandrum TaxID=41045 RepID=A0A8K1CSB2_PYTOL|nr:hypothetical protein Poli38472_007715 [Pythium oligandrum]|eukprot:TMW68043.1 hypothetical protein Poli38472_007715 [Pythium oligandrum]